MKLKGTIKGNLTETARKLKGILKKTLKRILKESYRNLKGIWQSPFGAGSRQSLPRHAFRLFLSFPFF